MKKILFILCTALVVASCNTKHAPSIETTHDFAADDSILYLTINHNEGDSMHIKRLNELPPVKNSGSCPKPFTEKSIELSLNVSAGKSGYLARRKLAEQSSNGDKSNADYIALDWCGNSPRLFKTSEEFVSYITEHGYKLAGQTENAHYGKDYIFNRL